MASDPLALILEREAELEAVEAALTAAAAGRGRLVLAEGPAGRGKTELLALARRQARHAGIRVMAAQGSELEREVPFGVALELFGRALQTARPVDRRALFRGAAALAEQLFTGAPTAADSTEHAPSEHPSSFPVVHGLYWLLANLAEGAPHLLTVDDAHWADPSSLRFLLYLAERLEGLPVALVVALRPEDAAAGGKAMARLRAVPQGRVLHLQPLSKDATADLTRSLYFPDADDGFCRAVFEVSEGNPFIVGEVLRAADQEELRPVAASAERVGHLAPESIVRATRTRLSQLSPDAGALAEAAAVLGSDAQLGHAARLGGLERPVAAAAADELVAARLLRAGEPLDFIHPPVRSAVYGDIPPGRRGALHAQAAALLEDDTPPERLATHLVQAHATGDARVVELLRAAARRALAVGAPEQAVRYLSRALAEPPPAADRAGLLVELGRVGAMIGDPEAVNHLRRAVQLLPDAATRGEALHEVGRALVNGGRYGEAAEALRQGLEEAGRGQSELRRRLLAALLEATRLRPGSREDDLIGRAESAVDHGGGPAPAPTPGLRALLGELAFEWLLAGGRFDDVRSAAHRALAGLDSSHTDDGADELSFYSAVAALTWADDLEVAEESLDRALAEAERRGRLMAVATASFRRATASYLRGALSAAIADAQRAVDASGQGWASYLPGARGILALALVERGELPRAAMALEPGAPTQDGGRSPTVAIFFHARATLHLVEGAPAEALDDALTAGRIMTEDLDSLTPAIVPWRSLAAVAHHRLGAVGEARRLAAEEVDLARQFSAPRALGVALRALGVVQGGARGLDRLRESADLLAGSPARLEHARTLAELGAALRRSGRADADAEAAGVLRQGLELAERCGATVLADRLSKELTAAGVRPPRPSRRSPAALTPGEARVAELAAGGLTNKAMAQQLFVSARAVEFHLGNIYTKLGISSRRQLAGALAQGLSGTA